MDIEFSDADGWLARRQLRSRMNVKLRKELNHDAT